MSERTTTSEVLHVLPVIEEVPRIVRRRRVTGRVRIAVTTSETSEAVEAVLRRRNAEVTRVPIGREVESPPPVRQEGDVLIVPVLEERLVLVRRLVLTEEVHLRLSTQEERVTLPASVMRQAAEVERVPVTRPDAESETPIAAEQFEDVPTMTRTITAMFDSRAEAERAREALVGLGLSSSQIQMHPGEDLTTQATSVRKDTGFMASLANMFMPDEDRHTYAEGMNRGHFMITAEVEERHVNHAMDALEAAGAVDLDTREAEWRSQGWQGAAAAGGTGAVIGASSSSDATGISAMSGDATVGTARTDASATTSTAQGVAGRNEAIPIVQESLRVGKREARAGRVRVRSYVVETPVEEQVRLREEHVHVERRPVNREVTGTDGALFQDRVVEATESVEEAVVQKDARVVEEVVVSKDATERTETVRDTVRRTEVEVDKDAANDQVRRGNKGVA